MPSFFEVAQFVDVNLPHKTIRYLFNACQNENKTFSYQFLLIHSTCLPFRAICRTITMRSNNNNSGTAAVIREMPPGFLAARWPIALVEWRIAYAMIRWGDGMTSQWRYSHKMNLRFRCTSLLLSMPRTSTHSKLLNYIRVEKFGVLRTKVD